MNPGKSAFTGDSPGAPTGCAPMNPSSILITGVPLQPQHQLRDI